jgi:predicted phage terminase large subunit-like protein
MTLPSERLRKIAKKAKEEYFFLAKEILGYQDLRQYPHQELCDIIERPGKRKKLVLMPRGSFKSSAVTVGYAIEAMKKDPNIRILISCETQVNARKYGGEIRAHLEENQKFRAIFGDWVSKDKVWRDDEFVINRRTKILKEPTLKAVSLEKMSVVGMHFDLIICDDVVSPLNVNTPEQIEKTINHYKSLLSVLDPQPDKRIVVVGTRWHINDLYGWIQDPEGEERDQFDIYVKQAIEDDGSLLLPDRLTHAYLDEQRKTQGPYLFSCNYLNNPINNETSTFQPEWFHPFYEKAPKNLIYFMTIDPALSTKNTADFTGLIVNGVDSKHDYWIQEAIMKRLSPSEQIDLIFQLAEKYQPMMCLGMEQWVLEKLLKVSLLEEMVKRNKFIPIKEIETDTRVSKEVRIRSLQPKAQGKQIHLKREHTSLYQQLVMFPQVKNDDLVDALKSQLAITFPASATDEKSEAKTYDHLPPREAEIWKAVDQIGRRRVHRTKEMDI